MIARIWSGAVRTTDADTYADYIAIPASLEHHRGDPRLRGRGHRSRRALPRGRALLIDGESRVTHYEVADHIPSPS